MENNSKGARKASIKLADMDFKPLLIGVLVILFTLVIFALYKRRKSARNGILFTGLCDSGKTLLFSQLLHQKYIQTHTSIKENIGDYRVNKSSLQCIDIPGHERLRDKFFEQYKSLAKGIVFVVDSLTLQKEIRDAAEFLYNILSDQVVAGNKANILILCNKQDQALAKGSNVIKSILEKELNTLKITKASQLESVDPKMNKTKILGDSKEFSFNNFNLKVDFAESNAFDKDGSANIEAVQKWITNIA